MQDWDFNSVAAAAVDRYLRVENAAAQEEDEDLKRRATAAIGGSG